VINVEDKDKKEIINRIELDESKNRKTWESKEDKNKDNIIEKHVLIIIETFWSFEYIARRIKAFWVWVIKADQRLSYFSICFCKSSMILFCLAIWHSKSSIQVSYVIICFCIFLQLIVASSTFFFILLMSFLFISISRTRKRSFFSIYSSNSRNIWFWAESKERS